MIIKTVKGFVGAVGGNAAAAKLFSVSRPAISNWTATGRFPAWATMRAMSISQANGLTVDPKLYTRARQPKRHAIHAAE